MRRVGKNRPEKSANMKALAQKAVIRQSPSISASICKELTDMGGFFKIAFGRIFCSAKNSGLPGVRNCRNAAIP
jgi:hypothetical protein